MYIQASEEFHVTDMRLICSQKKKKERKKVQVIFILIAIMYNFPPRGD